MQQKNLVVFMIASMLILVGWMWLQQQLFPGALKKDAAEDKKAVAEKKKKEEEKKPPPPPNVARWRELPSGIQDALMAALAVTSRMPGLPSLGDIAFRIHTTPEPETAPTAIVLGRNEKDTPESQKYFLTFRVTTLGAGVEEVVLNNFEGADRLGHPTHKKLDLVQQNAFYPSYLLYHYAQVGAEHPVTTLGQKIWTLETREPTVDAAGVQELRLSTRAPAPYSHLTITKIYRLAPREYHIGLALEIKDERDGRNIDSTTVFRYQLAGAHGLPLEGIWYTGTYRNSVVGMVDERNSLWRELEESRRISFREGGDRVPGGQRGNSFIQYAGVMDQFFAALIVVDNQQAPADDGGVDMKSILSWVRPTLESTEMHGQLRHIAADKKTVVVAVEEAKQPRIVRKWEQTFYLLPHAEADLDRLKEDDPVVVNFYHESGKRIVSRIRRGQELHPFADDITVRVHSEPIELKPGEKVVHKFMLYHGPVKVKLLGQMGDQSPSSDLVDRYTHTLHLRTLTDYGRFGWWTDLLIACTNLMHLLLYLLHFLVGSYGLTIFLLTLVVRGLMFPISRKQAYLSVRMQELAPEMKKLQEKYKNDPRGKQEAVMELYRKHHVHPLGGCLPLLLQMPIFLGLYYCLQESTHFRLAQFLWIDNLAAPDMLIWWGESIPWISDPDSMGNMLYLGPYFNLLPIIAVTVMIMQQKVLTPPPTDEQQEMQQKMMKYMMVFFGIMFYKVAAGLCMYFIASSLWGLAERKLLPKKKPALPPATAGGSGGKPQGGSGGKPPPGPQRPRPRTPGKNDSKKGDGAIQKVKDWWAEVLKQARKK